MYERINVLGFEGFIHGCPGNYYIFFRNGHINTCTTIFNNILNSDNLDINWNIILLKLYPNKFVKRCNYSILFLEFTTVTELKLFVLALNTRLRIIIR